MRGAAFPIEVIPCIHPMA
jgi:hypothetical protein